MRRLALAFAVLASFRCAGAPEEDFRPQIEAPRLLLPAQRLRLLKREAERSTPRWQAFAAAATGSRPLPEPGFAKALYFATTADKEAAAEASRWAESATDVRQIALVLDWCGPALTAEQRTRLAGKLPRSLPRSGEIGMATARDHAFAALALAEVDAAASERLLRDIVERWWRGGAAQRLGRGETLLRADEEQALLELVHAVNDNLRIDLREDAKAWFRALPRWHVLSHRSRPVASEGGEYFEPIFGGSPMLSRAAGLSLVALDANSQDGQFLQGWLMMDRATMRAGAGAVYEFLWANPYLPGLSYHHMPLWVHDPESGRLALRSSWDDDAEWLGTVGGPLKDDSGKAYAAASGAARPFGPHVIVMGLPKGPVGDAGTDVVVFGGLDPGGRYQLQSGSDRPSEVAADRNGFVSAQRAAGAAGGIRLSRGKARGR